MRTLTIIFLVIIAIFLCGCSTVKPVEVDIPIPVDGIAIKAHEKPYLPIEALTKDSKPSEVMKAYVATVKILIAQVNADDLEVEGYR